MFYLRTSLSRFLQKRIPSIPNIPNHCYTTTKNTDHQQTKSNPHPNADEKSLVISNKSFEAIDDKNKNTYLQMVYIFQDRDVRRRNHVEFIYAALKNMEAFGVHTDLDVYKALIEVMPKEKFIPRNMFQAEFMHYPKQQQCIIDLLEQMEDNGVMPDYEMQDILLNTFGKRGHPVLKYWRMMYWMPKFKNASPWLLPNPITKDSFELAKLAVERMCTVDLLSKISVYQTNDIESSIDDTWIVSGISPEQSKLLANHDIKYPLYIEGPFLIWLRNQSVNYFTLRGNASDDIIYHTDDNDTDDVSNLKFSKFADAAEHKIVRKRSIHEQDDGTIFAICATGTSTKDSLLSWIRLLEKDNNHILASTPILFKFRSVVSNQLVPAMMMDK